MIATFQDIQNHIVAQGLILDVRTREELRYGMIPTAKNIPLDELDDAFKFDSKTFQKKYDCIKPTKDTKIIVYCRTGARSAIAVKKLLALGFQAWNYKGSIWEWSTFDTNVQRYV